MFSATTSTPSRLQGTIYVAGHSGLAGSAILRRLRKRGYTDIVTAKHAALDLTIATNVDRFFAEHRPAHVFLAAGRVGGIWANQQYPADFIAINLAIQCNVIDAARRYQATKLLFLGSSCIYPKHAPQPLREEHLLSGCLEPTNEPYAVAKIAGIKMCSAYNRQYGTNYQCVMPTNLYGPGDHYDLENSHVLPALIRKAHEAKIAGDAELIVWGTGTPRREFMHSDDLASASVFVMESCNVVDTGDFVNVGVGEDVSIRELAHIVAAVVGFEGRLVFDASRPDGTPRKLLEVSRLRALGWSASIELESGIADAYRDFLERFDPVPAAARRPVIAQTAPAVPPL